MRRMARTSKSSLRLAALLVAVIIVSSVIPALCMPHEERGPAVWAAQEDEDSGTISAYVEDDVGRPISGAIVSVVGFGYTNVTNSTGFALLRDLPTDANWTEYTVYASKTGYYYIGWGVTVTVSPWNVTDVKLVINGGTLYGVVTDVNGPIQGATVSISPLGYSDSTDSSGVYSIYGVPGLTPYAVTASAPGYADSPPKEVTLETGGFSVLNFVLVSLTGSISGTVLHATTFEPLYNASVSVRIGTYTTTAYSAADGKYIIPGVPPGNYTVTASLQGFEPLSVMNVIVQSDMVAQDVDFLLVEKPTRLYGVVRSGTFLVPGVTIIVVGADIRANTSIDGEYEIKNITAGTYDVTASLEGYVSMTVTGVVIPRGGEVQVNFNIESLPGSSLSGVVLSSKTNSPVSGVEVVVIGLALQRNTITNVYGQFVVTGLPGGEYSVRFMLDGYKPKELGPVSVPTEGATVLEQVMLEPVSESFGGFIFGFDLAHSMMILALFLTIIILALAVMLRIRTFESPGKAPAEYDQEEPVEGGEAGAERGPEASVERERQRKKVKKRR